ncbi:MAG: iron-containing redox enzyme family protein, partial [Actinobacteria bacterium]|nr:iron-containing redox enzyme family protein [Actinomycetota bacterium]
ELHYRGLPGVDEGWEWEPTLLAARARIEAEFEASLREVAGAPLAPASDIECELRALTTGQNGPSLSRYMVEQGTLERFREFAVHRSAYQLKEADPHSWAIPRLAGRAKAAIVEIQNDEYGAGEPGGSHAELFAATMAALGLDATYGALLDRIPGVTLATVNLISYFGLHRRWRGALVGHLSVFEMTSVEPMSRYAAAVRRFGLPPGAARFYDVHVWQRRRADRLSGLARHAGRPRRHRRVRSRGGPAAGGALGRPAAPPLPAGPRPPCLEREGRRCAHRCAACPHRPHRHRRRGRPL